MQRINIAPHKKSKTKEKKLEPGEQKPKYGNNLGRIHKDIFQLPFNALIVGPRNSGKTVLLQTLLAKEDGMYGKFFRPENIILYSPTYDFDETLHHLKLKNVYTPPVDVCDVVEEIISQQQTFKDSNNMAPVLLVLEDVTQIRKAWVAMERLGYTGRHYNIHVIAIAHKMSSIFRGVRTQCQQWILYKPHEQSEFEWILDMFSRRSTRAAWETELKRIWSKRYAFIYINFDNEEHIYREGFHDPILALEALEVGASDLEGKRKMYSKAEDSDSENEYSNTIKRTRLE
jgi:hypothetical protein